MFSRLALFAALVVFATACGGGGGPAVPPAGTGAPGSPSLLTIRIDVPPAGTLSAQRAPRYISPAVTQMTIDVKQGGNEVSPFPETVALTPTSGGCTSSIASTQCQLTIALPPGSYTLTLTTLDASGRVLSTAQSVPVTIVQGANNQISLALSGVPHALRMLPASRLVIGSQAAGYALVGPTAQSFYVEAVDASDNIIVGPGAPTLTVTASGSLNLIVTGPTATAPNSLTLAPPAAYSAATAQLTVAATFPDQTDACAQTGAVCNATVAVSMRPIVGAFASDKSLTIFAAGDTEPLATLATGGTDSSPPTVFDRRTGTVAIRYGQGDLAFYTSPYDAAEITTTINQIPLGLAFGANDDLVAVTISGSVQVFAPPYTSRTSFNSLPGGDALTTPAVDSQGNLFFISSDGQPGASTVQELPPPYTGTATTVITGGTEQQLAFDAANDLFVLDSGDVTIYAPPYTQGSTTTITTGINGPVAFGLDGAGDVFVANHGNGTITEYKAPYTGAPAVMITTSATSTCASKICFAVDDGGDLFSESGSGPLTEFFPPYTDSPIQYSLPGKTFTSVGTAP